MISPEIIEEIRQKADIVQIISSYINVIKKGNSYVAICPFHNDTNPSMNISQSKQIYKCFVCGEGGNVFNFVSSYEKISYIDAVLKVADMIGFKSDELKKPTRKIDEKSKKALEALKGATELYKYLLKTEDGKKCSEYLKKRNILEDMQEYFSLGYSSSKPELTIKLLRSKGYEIESLEDCGILTRFNGEFIDRFSGRLIFPIYNEFSEVIGYSARIIEKSDQAKYINTKETILFNKSNVLYNYQNAKNEAKREGYVYVTEGFMDVFALYKVGIKSSVALMGTAFTSHHAKLLRKLNVEVRLCLDGDHAGQHGMLVASEILDKEQINYRIVDYKDVILDPDEILQQNGPNKLKLVVNQLIDKNQFVLNYYLKEADISTYEGKKKFAEDMVPYVSKISNPIDREMMVKNICFKTGISSNTYLKMLKRVDSTSIDSYEPVTEIVSKNVTPMSTRRLQRVQNKLLYQILCFKEACIDMEKSGCYFLNNIYEKIRNYILDGYQKNANFTVGELISNLSQNNDDGSKKLVETITTVITSDNQNEYDQEEMQEYLGILNIEIEKQQRKRFRKNLEGKTPEEQAKLYQEQVEARKGSK